MTPEEKINNLAFCQENLFQILTKEGERVPFFVNIYQQKLNEIVLKNKNKPLRLIILKCRQIGASTWASSFIYHRTTTNFYHRSMQIADNRDNTNGLFDMVKHFHEFTPEQLRPIKRYSNAKALIFENPDSLRRAKNPGLMSGIIVATAGRNTAGRSKTIQSLHCSEVAYWADAGKLITGLFQSVPYKKDTAIILESTANGIGGLGAEFHQRWVKAQNGDSGFIPVFFKWTDNPDYEIEPPFDFAITEQEKKMVILHPELTPRKLQFRRYKIANEMGSAVVEPEKQFMQEYPLTPEEAFISSGNTVYDIVRIQKDIQRALAVTLLEIPDRFRKWGGKWQIFKTPEKDCVYAIGADVAEGLVQGDLSSFCVLSKEGEHIASWAGTIPPDRFGMLLVEVGLWYNRALIAAEQNNHGIAVNNKIRDLKYFNVYTRQVKEERSENYTQKIGWLTTAKSKYEALDEFTALWRDDIFQIKDVELLREMSTIYVGDDGGVNLNSKDRVVAAMIAHQGRKQAMGRALAATFPKKGKEKSFSEKIKKIKKKSGGNFE